MKEHWSYIMNKEYKVDIKGDSIVELVNNLIYAHRTLGHELNSVILSEPMAWRLAYELNLVPMGDNAGKLFQLKKLVGSTLLGLNVYIDKHSPKDYVQVMEFYNV